MKLFSKFFHRMQVEKKLRWDRQYPEELPELPLVPPDIAQIKRIEGLESVCLFLGPYRNLTTLTASVLALHPQCQVLNHAGPRILPNQDLNFLEDYSDEKFLRFCHTALTMSQGGARGGYGGSIVLSHAFAEHQNVQKMYQRRFGTNLLKKEIKSLVWKESEMVGRFIRDRHVNLGALIQKNKRLKFLLPIRNPLDCSLSIARIGISKFYPEIKDGDVNSLVTSILSEIKWFLDLAKEHQQQFYYFLQNDINAQALSGLAQFLGLPLDQRWIEEGLYVYQLKKSYSYSRELRAHFETETKLIFRDYPAFASELMRMVD